MSNNEKNKYGEFNCAICTERTNFHGARLPDYLLNKVGSTGKYLNICATCAHFLRDELNKQINEGK